MTNDNFARISRRMGRASWICQRGTCAITAHVTGTMWKLLVKQGQHVTAGSPLLIVESMKMEIAVDAPVNGTVRQLFCKESGNVSAEQMLLVIQQD